MHLITILLSLSLVGFGQCYICKPIKKNYFELGIKAYSIKCYREGCFSTSKGQGSALLVNKRKQTLPDFCTYSQIVDTATGLCLANVDNRLQLEQCDDNIGQWFALEDHRFGATRFVSLYNGFGLEWNKFNEPLQFVENDETGWEIEYTE